jgi:hypothetical protein
MCERSVISGGALYREWRRMKGVADGEECCNGVDVAWKVVGDS